MGILYNHESHLRTENFVSKKIVKKAVQIKFNELKKLMLGDIHVQIDWGYALDYVSAMFKILTHNNPDEFIVSSGEKN